MTIELSVFIKPLLLLKTEDYIPGYIKKGILFHVTSWLAGLWVELPDESVIVNLVLKTSGIVYKALQWGK